MGFMSDFSKSIEATSLIDPVEELNNTLDVTIYPNPEDIGIDDDNSGWFTIDYQPLKYHKFYYDIAYKIDVGYIASLLPSKLNGRVRYLIVNIYYYYSLGNLIVTKNGNKEIEKIISYINQLTNDPDDLQKIIPEFWWAIDPNSKNLGVKKLDMCLDELKPDKGEYSLYDTYREFMGELNLLP